MRLQRRLIQAARAGLVLLFFGFLLMPIVVMIPASFTAGSFLQFPPEALSLRWYAFVLTSEAWLASAWVSLKIGTGAMLLSTLAGMLVGFSVYRFGRLPRGLRLLYLSPLLVPHIVVATGLFDLLVPLHLYGSGWVLALGHATMSLPISVVVSVAAFESLERSYWTAANTLGARWHQILGKVILPIIGATVAACLILTFENSWHEVTLAVFIGPGLTPTLPSKLFSLLLQENSPAFAAVSTLLLAVTLLVGLALALMPRRRFAAPEAER